MPTPATHSPAWYAINPPAVLRMAQDKRCHVKGKQAKMLDRLINECHEADSAAMRFSPVPYPEDGERYARYVEAADMATVMAWELKAFAEGI